jgi:ADP-L-glycero-D-manno-heptose 6-epimerase
MKILVTGGSGFVGSNLARKLVELDHKVLITSQGGEQPQIPGTTRLGYELGQIHDSRLKGVDMIYHQAANNDTQVLDKDVFWKENIFGPCKLFTQLRSLGCTKFVYASSTAVYGNSPAPYDETSTPLDCRTPYAWSKAHFEWWMDDFSKSEEWADYPPISSIGLRYCNVYGPGEGHKEHRASMIHQIIKRVKAGQSPRLFWDGEQRRDWVCVEDVVAANIACMNYHPTYDVMNIAYGKSYPFNGIASVVNHELGRRLETDWIDNPYGDLYQNHTECKIDKARKHLAYEPLYDLTSGIRHYLANWA